MLTKYKVIGILDILIGLMLVVYPLVVVLFILPKLSALYWEVGVNVFSNMFITQILSAVVLILGAASLCIGFKLLSSSGASKEKYFTYGIIFLILALVLGSFLIALSTISTILPIYDLTSSL